MWQMPSFEQHAQCLDIGKILDQDSRRGRNEIVYKPEGNGPDRRATDPGIKWADSRVVDSIGGQEHWSADVDVVKLICFYE